MTIETSATTTSPDAVNEIIEGMSTTKKVLIYSGIALAVIAVGVVGGKFLFGSASSTMDSLPAAE